MTKTTTKTALPPKAPPLETVTAAKRRRIIKTARAYLQSRRLDVPARFDVVALSPEGTLHIPAAFDAGGGAA